jgi:hypothetical protein
VEIEGPGLLDVTLWRQKDSMTVHLVNLTNPMMMKGPLREVLPIGPLRVRIRLPQGVQPKNVRLLTASVTSRLQQSNNVLTVSVPAVEVHEIVAIDIE